MTGHDYCLRGADHGTGRFQKETYLLNFCDLIRMVNRRVVARFLQMPLVVNRRPYDLARIGDRTNEPHVTNRDPLLAICELFDVLAEAVQMRDKGVEPWQRVSKTGKTIESRGDVDHALLPHQPEPIIAKTTKTHLVDLDNAGRQLCKPDLHRKANTIRPIHLGALLSGSFTASKVANSVLYR